jgi:hypothetical protein
VKPAAIERDTAVFSESVLLTLTLMLTTAGLSPFAVTQSTADTNLDAVALGAPSHPVTRTERSRTFLAAP